MKQIIIKSCKECVYVTCGGSCSKGGYMKIDDLDSIFIGCPLDSYDNEVIEHLKNDLKNQKEKERLDYFVGCALAGLLSNDKHDYVFRGKATEIAIKVAKETIKQLNEKQEATEEALLYVLTNLIK